MSDHTIVIIWVVKVWPITQSITPISPAPGKLCPRLVQPRQEPSLPPAPTLKSWFHYGKRRLLYFSSPLPARPMLQKCYSRQVQNDWVCIPPPSYNVQCRRLTCNGIIWEYWALITFASTRSWDRNSTLRHKMKRSKTNRTVGENKQFNNESWRL